jgi:hypothetical protein
MTPIETIGQSGPLGSCCTETSSSTDKYWVLKLPRIYPKPEFQIGEIVLYSDYISDVEADYIVRINGLNWTGLEWEYAIQLPVNHPRWKPCIDDNQYFMVSDQISRLKTPPKSNK